MCQVNFVKRLEKTTRRTHPILSITILASQELSKDYEVSCLNISHIDLILHFHRSVRYLRASAVVRHLAHRRCSGVLWCFSAKHSSDLHET